MDYLSVNEYAEIKGCTARNIKKSIQEGRLEAERVMNEKNRPKYLIPVTALPENLRNRYYKDKRSWGYSRSLRKLRKKSPRRKSGGWTRSLQRNGRR